MSVRPRVCRRMSWVVAVRWWIRPRELGMESVAWLLSSSWAVVRAMHLSVRCVSGASGGASDDARARGRGRFDGDGCGLARGLALHRDPDLHVGAYVCPCPCPARRLPSCHCASSLSAPRHPRRSPHAETADYCDGGGGSCCYDCLAPRLSYASCASPRPPTRTAPWAKVARLKASMTVAADCEQRRSRQRRRRCRGSCPCAAVLDSMLPAVVVLGRTRDAAVDDPSGAAGRAHRRLVALRMAGRMGMDDGCGHDRGHDRGHGRGHAHPRHAHPHACAGHGPAVVFPAGPLPPGGRY